jgi:hypothetical protein
MSRYFVCCFFFFIFHGTNNEGKDENDVVVVVYIFQFSLVLMNEFFSSEIVVIFDRFPCIQEIKVVRVALL